MSLVDTCSCGAPLSMLPKDHACPPAADAADAIVAEVMAYCQISQSEARELAELILARLGRG